MKHRFTLFSLLLLSLLHLVPLWAQDEGFVTQLQFGRQTVTVPANGELVFYDFKGTDDIASNSANNQHSLTVFKPAQEGMSVQITFESIDIRNDGASYPGKVLVYSGDPDPGNQFAWATNYSSVTGSMLMPDGEILATLDGTFSGLTYHSTASDGSLGVGVLWRYAKACKGWVAKVKCVTLTDMQVTGAASDYTGVAASPSSKTNVPLAHATIKAEGVMNPDHITGIHFSLPLNQDVIDPTAVKLYADGRDGVAGATPLETTIIADEDGYLITLDEEISSGTNWYTLATDMLGTAKVGDKVKVVIDKVTTTAHPDGVTPFTAADAVEISNPAIVCLNPGEQTIYVDHTPLAFYDDGGLDGDVSANLSGKVTFIPSVEGEKVQIDFTKIKIGKGSIYWQYINVYNGTETSQANLIMSLRCDDTALIHSTSPDGALTVEFGDNGSSYTGEGFEAEVSLFKPQAMEFVDMAMTGTSEATVRAGAQAVPMATVNIVTRNTEPVLTLDSFTLASTGTSGVVDMAFLATASDSPKVLATATESDGKITFTLAQPFALSEGDNILMVLANVSDKALNDQEIKLSLASTVLGGTSHEGDGTTVSRKIYNKVVSDAGTQDVTIYGKWEVSNKPSDYSYYGYDDIPGDQVITIRPGVEGAMTQLTFSKLAIRFPSYSYYGSNPKFKVINGAGTTGTVLFEADKNNQTAQIGATIRSTDPSGALTILFNTNGNRGTSTSDGFIAEAVPYKSQPMAVREVDVIQASDKDIYPSGIEEEVLRLDVITEGAESPLAIDELTVDLKGCEEWVETVKLISSGSNKDYVQPVVTVASAPAAASVTLKPADDSFKLNENDNYLWLAFDMKDKLSDNHEVDAKIVSMKIGGQNIAVNTPDPEGVRLTKNIYLFHGDDVVEVDEPFIFCDNGGPDAYYTRDYSGSVVFKPADPSKVVRMKFISFKTGYNDELYIYNGSGTDDSNLLQKLYGDKSEPKDATSSTADGALTARFRTGSYGLTDDGWQISVETFTPAPLTLSSVTPESAASAQVYSGSQDNRMLHVQVQVDGERGNFNLTNIKFDTASSAPEAIAEAKVWATGTEPTFLGPVQFGESISPAEGQQSLDFNGEYNFPHAGTYHFWLTYDVAPSQEVGTELKARLTEVTIGGLISEIDTEITASSSVRAGMHGDYTIGTSGKADYTTFAAAIRDLSNIGVDGPVDMLIEDGIYEEAFTFTPIPGASETNRVTFRSESGNRDKVVIKYGEPDQNLYSSVVGFADGASFITLQSITVTSPADKCDGIIKLTGGCLHNTIDDCVVSGHTAAIYEERVTLIYTYYLEQHDKNCNYFTLSNSRLEGGYLGLSVTGITNLNYPMMLHHVNVIGNTFVNQSSKALQAMGVADGLVVRDNRFVNDGTLQTTDFRNIDLYRCTGNVVLADNIMDLTVGYMTNYDTQETQSYGYAVYVRDISSARASHKRIFNNDIHIRGAEGTNHTIYGLNFYDNDPDLQSADIAYNTIVVSGPCSEYSSPYMMSAAMTGSTLVDNLLQNNAGGPALRGTAKGSLSGLTISDNALYTTGEIWIMNPTDYNSIDAAATAIGQPIGIAEKANFLSDDMRELRIPGNLMTAKPLDYVATDLLGNPRNATTPTIGAYEYADQTGVPAWNENYPAIDGISTASARLNLCADKASVATYIVLRADDATPADEAWTDAQSLTLHTGKPATTTITGLNEATPYKVYVKLISCLGEDAGSIAELSFTTLSSEPVYSNPVAEITTTDVTVGNEGDTISLSAEASGGMEPLSYCWTDQTGKVLANGNDVTVTLSHSMTYRFTVTDARGKKAFDEINIDVRGNQYMATFEDLNIPSESYWGGNDTNEPFYSGSFAFDYYHDNYDGYEYWGHFSYANLTSTSYTEIKDQYNSSVGSGVEGSSTYGVAYVDSYIGATYLTVTNNTDGDNVKGMWVTNSAWVMDCIKNGDGYSSVPGGFAKDDWFKLTVTGLLDAKRTGSVDFYLADYRADNEVDRYALDSWQWLDLAPLGKVNKLWFELQSTKKNGISMTTPAYFCLDNVGEACPWRDTSDQTVTVVDKGVGALDLNALFEYDPAKGTMTYSVESPDNIATLDTATPGLVNIDGASGEYADEPFMLMAKATQQGRSEYLRIPVKINYETNESGITSLLADAVKVYPVPAHDVLNISTSIAGYSAELFDMQGALVLTADNLDGMTQIDLPALEPGVYMLRINHESGYAVRRIIIK